MNTYDKYTKKQIELLNLQMLASVIFIITIIVSIYLTYSDKQNIINNKKESNLDLSLLNRIVVLILALVYIYINLNNTYIAKKRNQNLDSFYIENIASFVALLAALLILYVVYINRKNNSFNVSDIENPTL